MGEQLFGSDIGLEATERLAWESSSNRSQSRPTVMFHWQPSSFHGWGVYGLNLMLHWARRPDLSVCCSSLLEASLLDLNPVERRVIDQVLIESREAYARLRNLRGGVRLSCVLLHGLGNNLSRSGSSRGLELLGTPSIGIIFFEWNKFDGN